jgi:DNA sulfur modification protein DndC
MQTIELFALNEIMPTLDERVERARRAIAQIFDGNHIAFCQLSGGKDSSVVTALVLSVAREYAAAGHRPLVVVVSADTLVESPEMVEHVQAEFARIRAYAKQHAFEVVTRTVSPSLAASWQVWVLSGRALPSYAGQNSDCAESLKISPALVYRHQFWRDARKRGYAEPVVNLGSRFSESEKRKASMKGRGDRADAPVRNRDGDLILCPIAAWETETVWEYIGEVASGLREAYTDFGEVKRIYAHAGNSSCAIVSDLSFEEASAGKRKRRGTCSARTGCWVCQQAEDKSLEEMINFDEERYAYARGLNRLNRFLRAIRYDWSRRNWVGRTIRQGWICIEPDTFSAATVRELTRYMMTLDRDEQIRAARAGTKPKFQTLPLETLIAVDAMQSLQGLAAPMQIWADYRDIYERGVRFEVPEIAPFPPVAMPEPLFLHVGRDWDDTAEGLTGFRDPLFEALTADSPCAPAILTLKDGRTTWEVPTGQRLEVDTEAAVLMLDFELEQLLEMHDRGFFPGGITAGYRWYLSYGVLSLSHSQQDEHDAIARRTDFKDRLGLNLDYDIEGLRRRSVRYADLPAAARAAWAHKATTAGAQTSMSFALDLGLAA